jgi:hypothetical protein
MSKSTGKQLNVAAIHKSHSEQFSELKRVTLKNGDYIDVQLRFKTTSIQQMLVDYQAILEQLREREVDMDAVKDMTFIYYMLLLRHFTSLTSIPADIDKLVVLCKKLVDLELLGEILDAFDPAELDKITRMIKNISENGDVIGKQFGEIFAKAAFNEAAGADGGREAEAAEPAQEQTLVKESGKEPVQAQGKIRKRNTTKRKDAQL